MDAGRGAEVDSPNRSGWFSAGAIAAALGSSLCCILPVAAALLGTSFGALGAAFEPWRPWLTLVTFAFQGFAFYRVYRRSPSSGCGGQEECAPPPRRRRERLLVWSAAVVAALLFASPYLMDLVL